MVIGKAYRNWLWISIFNLFLLALVGTLLRYKIAFALPIVDQKSLLHAHSHFAFAGWITQALLILLVHAVSVISGTDIHRRYIKLWMLNLISAYGMLFAFPLTGGYGAVSIAFSTISMLGNWWFGIMLWRDMNRSERRGISFYWFKMAIVFMFMSSAGPFALAYQMSTHSTDVRWHLIAEYFFLHFQYNGWFLFSLMGLLHAVIPANLKHDIRLLRVFAFYTIACIPAYFLSVLWLDIPLAVYWIIVFAALLQVAGWLLLIPVMRESKLRRGIGRSLWILAAFAFSIKLLLQAGSTIPELSHFAFGYRPVVIGYLHLMLLGVCTLFIIGYAFHAGFLSDNKGAIAGVWIFTAGVIYNEVLLFIQGLTAVIGTYIASIQYWLFSAALTMLIGMGVLVVKGKKLKVEN